MYRAGDNCVRVYEIRGLPIERDEKKITFLFLVSPLFCSSVPWIAMLCAEPTTPIDAETRKRHPDQWRVFFHTIVDNTDKIAKHMGQSRWLADVSYRFFDIMANVCKKEELTCSPKVRGEADAKETENEFALRLSKKVTIRCSMNDRAALCFAKPSDLRFAWAKTLHAISDMAEERYGRQTWQNLAHLLRELNAPYTLFEDIELILEYIGVAQYVPFFVIEAKLVHWVARFINVGQLTVLNTPRQRESAVTTINKDPFAVLIMTLLTLANTYLDMGTVKNPEIAFQYCGDFLRMLLIRETCASTSPTATLHVLRHLYRSLSRLHSFQLDRAKKDMVEHVLTTSPFKIVYDTAQSHAYPNLIPDIQQEQQHDPVSCCHRTGHATDAEQHDRVRDRCSSAMPRRPRTLRGNQNGLTSVHKA